MTELQVNKLKKQKGLRRDQPQVLQTTPGGACPPAALRDVRGPFLATNLIVVWWQLVQELLYARFFSWAVDVGHLVLRQAAVVLVHLWSKRKDCSEAPWPSLCPATSQPPSQQALGLPRDFKQGKHIHALLWFYCLFPMEKRGSRACYRLLGQPP